MTSTPPSRQPRKRCTRTLALLYITTFPVNAFQNPRLDPQTHQSIAKRQTRSDFALHLAPEVAAAGAAALCGGGALLWFSGAEERSRRSQYAEWDAEEKERREEMARRAYIEPRDDSEPWTLEELSRYDGTESDDGPILFAADGIVFNVWKGRNSFYGPGCEYHIFAGRDASRLLAKSKLEEETEEEASKPLNVGERAALAGWIWTFSKYDKVGRLDGFDASTTAL